MPWLKPERWTSGHSQVGHLLTGNITAKCPKRCRSHRLKKNLIIDARDNTIRNVTSASSVAGGQEMTQKIGQSVAKGAEFVQSKWGEKAPVLDEKSGNTGGLQIAGHFHRGKWIRAPKRELAHPAVSAANDIVVNAETKTRGCRIKQPATFASKDGQADAAISGAWPTEHTSGVPSLSR